MNKIKIISSLALAVFMAVAMCACNSAKDKLTETVEKTNAKCPYGCGWTGDLHKVKYDEKKNQVEADYSITNALWYIDTLKTMEPEMAELMNMIIQDNTIRTIVQAAVEADASVEFHFGQMGSEDSFDKSFDSSQLAKFLSMPLLSQDEKKRMELEMIDRAMCDVCPLKLSDRSVLESVKVDGNYEIYTVIITTPGVTTSGIKKQEKEYREFFASLLREGFKSQGTKGAVFRTLASLDMGLCFRLRGSGDSEYFDIVFKPEVISHMKQAYSKYRS